MSGLQTRRLLLWGRLRPSRAWKKSAVPIAYAHGYTRPVAAPCNPAIWRNPDALLRLQSNLMFASRATLPHFAVSALRNSTNSSGGLITYSLPALASFSLVSGAPSAFVVSA